MLKLESIFLLRHRGGNGNDRVSLSLSLSQRRDASTGLGRRKILAVARMDGTVAFHGFFYAARIFRARKEFLLGRVIAIFLIRVIDAFLKNILTFLLFKL